VDKVHDSYCIEIIFFFSFILQNFLINTNKLFKQIELLLILGCDARRLHKVVVIDAVFASVMSENVW
jgi:hypothetical protein